VRLDFLDPGGSVTGKLLPTGHVVDRLAVPGIGPIEVSMVDAATACVFVRSQDIGLTGNEMPDSLDADASVLDRLQRIRRAAAMAIGIAGNEAEALRSNAVPAIGFVAPAMEARTLAAETIAPDQVDLTARFISNGQPHRALPLTASLCTAVAARIEGTLPFRALHTYPAGAVRIGMPSGILTVDADVSHSASDGWVAQSGAFYRTARRLFDGRIYVPQEDPAT
jgi:2-methylaconitate isomerase